MNLNKVNWNSLVALGLMFVVVAACSNLRKRSSDSPTSNARETRASESAAPGQISAEDLFQEFQKDKDAAERKYKGQMVTVTGTIDKVKIGPSGNPYVLMKTSSLVLRVQFLFDKSNEAALSQLKEGERVTIRGRVFGRIGNVVIDDCEIL